MEKSYMIAQSLLNFWIIKTLSTPPLKHLYVAIVDFLKKIWQTFFNQKGSINEIKYR